MYLHCTPPWHQFGSREPAMVEWPAQRDGHDHDAKPPVLPVLVTLADWERYKMRP